MILLFWIRMMEKDIALPCELKPSDIQRPQEKS